MVYFEAHREVLLPDTLNEHMPLTDEGEKARRIKGHLMIVVDGDTML